MIERYVRKLNDRDLVRAFEQIRDAYANDECSIEFKDQFSHLIDGGLLKEVIDLAGYGIRSARLKIDDTSWILSRLEDAERISLDKVAINFPNTEGYRNGNPKDKAKFLKADALFSRVLMGPLATGSVSSSFDIDGDRGFILEKMESVAAHLIEDADRHRKRLELEHFENERRRQEHHDNLLAEARKKIDDERARADSEILKRRAALDEKELALNDLKKSLDDRNNTHVRREIRSSLLQLAKDRLDNFNLSGTTRKQYLTVNVASSVGFLLLVGASFYYGSKVSVDPSAHKYTQEAIALIIKSGSYAAAAIALGSWYLGWLNRWLQRIADSEFKLQQFRLDIERASWLAETVLEWKSSSEEPFPELLAARLSAGLFQSSGADADGPKTPASHLAEALFGAATSAKVRLGENELNFDRKAVQRLGE